VGRLENSSLLPISSERAASSSKHLPRNARNRSRRENADRCAPSELIISELSTSLDFCSWLSIQRPLNYLFMIRRPSNAPLYSYRPAEFHAQMYAAAIRAGDGFYGVNFQMQSCMSASRRRSRLFKNCSAIAKPSSPL